MSLQRTWKTFFDPQYFTPFLIGSVALGMVSNGLYGAVVSAFGEEGEKPSYQLGIAFGAACILALAVIFTRWRLSTSSGGDLKMKSPREHRGLVLLVNREEACWMAIKHHLSKLEVLFLICSKESSPLAGKLKTDLASNHPKMTVTIMDEVDVNDPKMVYDRVRQAYGSLPIDFPPDEMISDYTGMTAHCSVGMVLACMERGWPLEYVPAKYNEELRALSSLPPIEIGLSYKPNSLGARSQVVAANSGGASVGSAVQS